MKSIYIKKSKKGNLHTNYKDCKIVVKYSIKKGLFIGRIFRGDLSCRLIGGSDVKLMFKMAIDHIDENY